MKRLVLFLCLICSISFGQTHLRNVRIVDPDDSTRKAKVNADGQLRTTLYDELGNPINILSLADGNKINGSNAVIVASTLYGFINSTQAVPLRVDASTHSIQTLTYEHHEIHSGSHYYIEDVADLSLNNVYDMQWVTPNTTKWSHFIFELNCESETEWMIYEGAVITNAGSAVVAINNNRNSTNTSVNTITSQLNTSLANANLDTSVLAATEIAHGIVGAGKDSGSVTRSDELILKQNTTYCMRAIATAAGYINFRVKWYEHTDKD